MSGTLQSQYQSLTVQIQSLANENNQLPTASTTEGDYAPLFTTVINIANEEISYDQSWEAQYGTPPGGDPIPGLQAFDAPNTAADSYLSGIAMGDFSPDEDGALGEAVDDYIADLSGALLSPPNAPPTTPSTDTDVNGIDNNALYDDQPTDPGNGALTIFAYGNIAQVGQTTSDATQLSNWSFVQPAGNLVAPVDLQNLANAFASGPAPRLPGLSDFVTFGLYHGANSLGDSLPQSGTVNGTILADGVEFQNGPWVVTGMIGTPGMSVGYFSSDADLGVPGLPGSSALDIAAGGSITTGSFYQYQGNTTVDGTLSIGTGIIWDDIGSSTLARVNGTITIDPTGLLGIADSDGYTAATDSNNTIDIAFNGSGGRFILGNPQFFTAEKITDFAPGDTLDLNGVAPADVTTGGSGLVVTNGGTTTNLQLAFTGGTLQIASDNNGGTTVTVAPPTTTQPSTTTPTPAQDPTFVFPLETMQAMQAEPMTFIQALEGNVANEDNKLTAVSIATGTPGRAFLDALDAGTVVKDAASHIVAGQSTSLETQNLQGLIAEDPEFSQTNQVQGAAFLDGLTGGSPTMTAADFNSVYSFLSSTITDPAAHDALTKLDIAAGNFFLTVNSAINGGTDPTTAVNQAFAAAVQQNPGY